MSRTAEVRFFVSGAVVRRLAKAVRKGQKMKEHNPVGGGVLDAPQSCDNGKAVSE